MAKHKNNGAAAEARAGSNWWPKPASPPLDKTRLGQLIDMISNIKAHDMVAAS